MIKFKSCKGGATVFSLTIIIISLIRVDGRWNQLGMPTEWSWFVYSSVGLLQCLTRVLSTTYFGLYKMKNLLDKEFNNVMLVDSFALCKMIDSNIKFRTHPWVP